MNASIITIGNELLKGFTLDSNSSYIGSKLTDLGVRIVWKATPEDNSDEIIETINIANSNRNLERYDEAAKYYGYSEKKIAKCQQLECFYMLGDHLKFYEKNFLY